MNLNLFLFNINVQKLLKLKFHLLNVQELQNLKS